MKIKKKLTEYEYIAKAGWRATIISILVCGVLSAVASIEYDVSLTWLLGTNVAVVFFVRLTVRETASLNYVEYLKYMIEKEREGDLNKKDKR